MSLVDFLDNPAGRGSLRGSADPRALAFHRSMPGYAPSPIAEAPTAAEQLGLSRLAVKLETARFGLPSFKILGASWAICRAVSRRSGREPAATFDELRTMSTRLDGLTLITATDGNHGRAVAHMARLLDFGARILVPAGTAAARIEAIAGEGASVQIVDGSYDDGGRAGSGPRRRRAPCHLRHLVAGL